MKLFHFTGLRRLLGDGFEAWKTAFDEGKASPSAIPYATPDSILVGGLKPFRTDDLYGALRMPLPACVWLTDDPAMSQDYCAWHGWRLTVVVSSSDRKLVHWPKYFRKHEIYRDALLAVPEAQRRVSFGSCCRIGAQACFKPPEAGSPAACRTSGRSPE